MIDVGEIFERFSSFTNPEALRDFRISALLNAMPVN